MDNDVYQSRQDPAIRVGVRLAEGPSRVAVPDLHHYALDPAVDGRGWPSTRRSSYIQVRVPTVADTPVRVARLGASRESWGSTRQFWPPTGADLLGLRYLRRSLVVFVEGARRTTRFRCWW